MYIDNNSIAAMNRKTPTNNKQPQNNQNQNFIDQKNPMNAKVRRNSFDSRIDNKNKPQTNNQAYTPSNHIEVSSIITQVERPNSKTTSSKNKEVITYLQF